MFPACSFRQRTYVALLMGYLIRLELALVSSLNYIWLVKWVYMGVILSLSWNMFTLVCFTDLEYSIFIGSLTIGRN